ncbi:MAG: CPBP family intramembrane metalloprotease [Bacteriovoracaceae bacterium]|jgi:membrane protease YdiL (CAAX protease family)|nr:CPBP family intramembrane metalloprotease [Bacteriovoracaceae bacterium]
MKSRWSYIFLIIAYIIPSFSFDFLFDFWGQGLIPYYFEFIFVVTSIYIFKEKLQFYSKDKKPKHFLRYLLAGLITIIFCKLFSTQLPYDLSSATVKVFLVLIGPLLEEFIFRFAIWNAIEKFTTCKKAPLHITSILFSIAHFKGILLITPPYMTFITFQALYTLLLGYTLGMRYEKKKNIMEIVVLHVLFNLGFLLGYMGLY